VAEPIDRLLDTVEWKELPSAGQRMRERGLPIATHEGVLRIGDGIELRCYQLDDGRRIFDGKDVEALFGATSEGER
jgi:hypothetical protein